MPFRGPLGPRAACPESRAANAPASLRSHDALLYVPASQPERAAVTQSDRVKVLPAGDLSGGPTLAAAVTIDYPHDRHELRPRGPLSNGRRPPYSSLPIHNPLAAGGIATLPTVVPMVVP